MLIASQWINPVPVDSNGAYSNFLDNVATPWAQLLGTHCSTRAYNIANHYTMIRIGVSERNTITGHPKEARHTM